MDKEHQLRQALNYLSNNWRCDPKLRLAFEGISQTLSAGSQNDKENLKILLDYMNYPGSNLALDAATALHASLQTGPGRNAAGMPQKRRGRKNSPAEVKLEDNLMQVLIRHELGLATDFDLESALIDRIGWNPVKATQKAFIEELKPRAQMWAKFFSHMQSSYKKGLPL